jgi:phosphocarrier protein HPr
MTLKITLSIINEKGLHARASAKFVETVEEFEASALVTKDGMTVPGDSIMGLLMLAASKGTQVDVVMNGADAGQLALALENLVSDYFGEGR